MGQPPSTTELHATRADLAAERSIALGAAWHELRVRGAIAGNLFGIALALGFQWFEVAIATAVSILGTLIAIRAVRAGRFDPAVEIGRDALVIAVVLTLVDAPPVAVGLYIAYYLVVAMVVAPARTAWIAVITVPLAAAILVLPGVLGVTTSETQQLLVGIGSSAIFIGNTVTLLSVVARELRRLDSRTAARLRLAEAVADSATDLLAGRGESRLDATLIRLREALGSDSVFVERNSEEPGVGLCSSLVAIAQADDDLVDLNHWTQVAWETYPRAHASLARGDAFRFRVDELDGRERAMYEGTSVGAELDIPVMIDDRWLGIVGVTEQDADHVWSREEVALLRSVADMIGAHWVQEESMLTRQALIESLDGRLRYEQAMATCSRALLGGVDAGVDEALQALIAATGVEYAYVDVNVGHDRLGVCAALQYEAIRPGFAETIPSDRWTDPATGEVFTDVLPYAAMPLVHGALKEGKPSLTITAELPEGPERAIFEDAGVTSELCLPFSVQGSWHGSVGFIQYDEPRSWDTLEIEVLLTAAEMFGAAFERQVAKDRLESLVASKDELIAGVSHELRTPLTVVLGLSDELSNAQEFDASEARSLMAMVASQSKEMADIVEDLLVAARADDGSVSVAPETIDLRDVVDGVATYLVLPQGRTLDIEGRGYTAWADVGRVRQIVRNLLTNAVRYGGDHITVWLDSRDGVSFIEVVDDGVGIPPGSEGAIFEPYQRAHNSVTQPSSVGLGLTLSRRLARLMGGDLVYEWRSNQCVFRLTLPASEITTPAAQAS